MKKWVYFNHIKLFNLWTTLAGFWSLFFSELLWCLGRISKFIILFKVPIFVFLRLETSFLKKENLPYPSAANDLIVLGFVWSEYFLVLLLCSCDLLNYKQETNPRIIRHSAWLEEGEKNKNLMWLNTRMSFLITGSQAPDSNSEHLNSLCIKISSARSLWVLFFMAWNFWGEGKWQPLLTARMGMSHKFLNQECKSSLF